MLSINFNGARAKARRLAKKLFQYFKRELGAQTSVVAVEVIRDGWVLDII